MPGKGAKEPEAEVPRNDGFHRITNVSRPTLTLFPAPRKAGATAAPAMIVCPGGGYGYTVIDKAGTEIAAWLNSAGISALVLKYRTPNTAPGRAGCQRAEPRRERARKGHRRRARIIGSPRRRSAARTSTSSRAERPGLERSPQAAGRIPVLLPGLPPDDKRAASPADIAAAIQPMLTSTQTKNQRGRQKNTTPRSPRRRCDNLLLPPGGHATACIARARQSWPETR